MITTEDYNSIWEHFSNGFINYYNFNTAERDEKIYSYDFLTVEKLQNKIRNFAFCYVIFFKVLQNLRELTFEL